MWTEVVWSKRKETGQAHHEVVDETCYEWMTFTMRTQVRVMVKVRDTEKMCVRQGVLSSLPVACTTFADVYTRNMRKNPLWL